VYGVKAGEPTLQKRWGSLSDVELHAAVAYLAEAQVFTGNRVVLSRHMSTGMDNIFQVSILGKRC